MTDLADAAGHNAFLEASRRNEEAARGTIADEAVDTPDDVEQPRDDKGRFTIPDPETVEAPDVEAPVVEAEQVEEAEAAAERLLAGKYRSVEDLERAYQDMESVLGRQGSELDQYRKSVDDRFDQFDEKLSQGNRQQITSDYIEQNPAAAAQLAFEQRDQYALTAAFEQWKLEDPASAATWAMEKRYEQREAELRQTFEERISQIEASTKPLLESANSQQLAQEFGRLPQETRDFVGTDVARTLAEEFPILGNAVASGSPREKVDAISALYQIARGRSADTLTNAVSQAHQEDALEAEKARQDAQVVSTDAGSANSEPLSYAEQERANMTAAIARRNNNWWTTSRNSR